MREMAIGVHVLTHGWMELLRKKVMSFVAYAAKLKKLLFNLTKVFETNEI